MIETRQAQVGDTVRSHDFPDREGTERPLNCYVEGVVIDADEHWVVIRREAVVFEGRRHDFSEIGPAIVRAPQNGMPRLMSSGPNKVTHGVEILSR